MFEVYSMSKEDKQALLLAVCLYAILGLLLTALTLFVA